MCRRAPGSAAARWSSGGRVTSAGAAPDATLRLSRRGAGGPRPTAVTSSAAPQRPNPANAIWAGEGWRSRVQAGSREDASDAFDFPELESLQCTNTRQSTMYCRTPFRPHPTGAPCTSIRKGQRKWKMRFDMIGPMENRRDGLQARSSHAYVAFAARRGPVSTDGIRSLYTRPPSKR